MNDEIDDEDFFGIHDSNDLLSVAPPTLRNLTTFTDNPENNNNNPSNSTSSIFTPSALSSTSPAVFSQQTKSQPKAQQQQQQQINHKQQSLPPSKPPISPPQGSPSAVSVVATFLSGTGGQHKLSKKEKQKKDEYYKKLKDENEQLFMQIEQLKRLISTREAENVVLQQQVEFFMKCAGDTPSAAHENEK